MKLWPYIVFTDESSHGAMFKTKKIPSVISIFSNKRFEKKQILGEIYYQIASIRLTDIVTVVLVVMLVI